MSNQGRRLLRIFCNGCLILIGLLSFPSLFGNSQNNLSSDNIQLPSSLFEENKNDFSFIDEESCSDLSEENQTVVDDTFPFFNDLSVGSGSCASAWMVVPTDPFIMLIKKIALQGNAGPPKYVSTIQKNIYFTPFLNGQLFFYPLDKLSNEKSYVMLFDTICYEA